MDDIKSEASPSPETIAMFMNQRRFSMPNMYGYSMNPMIPVGGGMDMALNMDNMGLMDMNLSMDLLMPLAFPNPMLLELQQQQQQQQHQPNPYHCAPAPIVPSTAAAAASAAACIPMPPLPTESDSASDSAVSAAAGFDYSEPGFDILLATPPTSPESILAKRRGSCPGLADKSTRLRTTETELQMLTAIFQKNPFPSAFLRKKLAERMGVTVKQVQFWFQNRRATLKDKNGIHVLKPTKGDSPSSFSAKTRRMSLQPLSNESPYFFVQAETEGTAGAAAATQQPNLPKPSLDLD
ncbi:hypothetical protein CcCBS67573_g07806 [Chytriomyces confervae]|uniref:Homeobox domain-containing protein n=1 Tax=Chytriomyces confervae TaxID=246404 RepID=A0A507ERN7_9FUNG|nr:hypothetical protein CcCBS67573_g07806 [Chytriomyces confervae]